MTTIVSDSYSVGQGAGVILSAAAWTFLGKSLDATETPYRINLASAFDCVDVWRRRELTVGKKGPKKKPMTPRAAASATMLGTSQKMS